MQGYTVNFSPYIVIFPFIHIILQLHLSYGHEGLNMHVDAHGEIHIVHEHTHF